MSEAFGEVLHSITHESLPFNFFNIASNDCSKLFSEGGEGAGRGGVRDGALVCPVARIQAQPFFVIAQVGPEMGAMGNVCTRNGTSSFVPSNFHNLEKTIS